MYNLMIVDDETSVVDSIALTISWKEHGIQDVHRAYSAQEALQIAANHNIHIMVTDIQMPEMNGLRLIEELKKVSPHTRSIILSGYDDFSYAQQAIKQRTVDYLLKPVNIKTLVKTVERAKSELELNLRKKDSYERLKHMLDVNLPTLRRQLLLDLLTDNKIENNFLERRLAVTNVSFCLDDSYVMLVVGVETGFPEYDLQSFSLIKFAVGNIIEEVFQNHFSLWGCTDDHGFLIFLVKSDKYEHLNHVESFVVTLQDKVQTYLKGALTVYISQVGIFPYDLHVHYMQAIEGMKYRGKKNIITAEDISLTKQEYSVNFHETPTINSLLEQGDFDGVLSRISHFLAIDKDEETFSQDYLFTVLLHLSSSFYPMLNRENSLIKDQLGGELYMLLQKKSLITRKRIFRWAQKVISHFRSQSIREIEDPGQRIVAGVQAFIYENLSNDTSLQMIAEKIDLHPVYLAKVYKEVTNETIGDYIHRLRMKRADYLLKKTKLKIVDVSSQLGFISQSHFIKVFKKHYGCTPQQYRRNKTNTIYKSKAT